MLSSGSIESLKTGTLHGSEYNFSVPWYCSDGYMELSESGSSQDNARLIFIVMVREK